MKRFHDQLRGLKVVGANGRAFGDVHDIEIDEATWQVKSLIVRINSDVVTDLGLEKPFWSRARLSVPVNQVSGATDVVVLRTSIEELVQLVAAAESETYETT